MAKTYPHRMFIILSDADREAGNQIATEIGNGENERSTYDVPLSADGSEPATDWACSTLASDPMRIKMVEAMLAGRVPSVRFFMLDAKRGTLIDTNVPSAIEAARWGEKWTFEDALNAIERKRVTPEVL
jgi:hypothetical protein